MPNESHAITFSNAEASDALVSYCATAKRQLPNGGIKRLAFSNDAEIKVTAEFNNGAAAITFFQNEVAAALILACNKKGIPVPKRAIKTLAIGQDSIALRFAMRT